MSHDSRSSSSRPVYKDVDLDLVSGGATHAVPVAAPVGSGSGFGLGGVTPSFGHPGLGSGLGFGGGGGGAGSADGWDFHMGGVMPAAHPSVGAGSVTAGGGSGFGPNGFAGGDPFHPSSGAGAGQSNVDPFHPNGASGPMRGFGPSDVPYGVGAGSVQTGAHAPIGHDSWSNQAQSFASGSTSIVTPTAQELATAAGAVSTTSFDIKNWGDPHVNVNVNGRDIGQIDHSASIQNFETFHLTAGGPTTISTQTTAQDESTVAFNREVDITGASWSVQATGEGGGLSATVHDAHGTWTLGSGQSVTEADGTVITNNGGIVSVSEHLLDGGTVSTDISMNGAGYLDFESKGQGDVGLTGWAADQWKGQGGSAS
ncbi:MAG: hypothetical protein U0235_02900 [Polyangiaceae bacterium]